MPVILACWGPAPPGGASLLPAGPVTRERAFLAAFAWASAQAAVDGVILYLPATHEALLGALAAFRLAFPQPVPVELRERTRAGSWRPSVRYRVGGGRWDRMEVPPCG
ncbi:protein of unknown function [Candidatus Hydrogenisulfobacillus filiaventi]|uniref:Uncharacterized protein n=1 Tax=Candidatus Hydrogenisulfobacillus filiaventi TaxID=2707344 RepID=A0A6F8ZHT8_9FIRM|nr:protein of unknown function [Candidatus Hydrogenisulfobacillus filiaventi]